MNGRGVKPARLAFWAVGVLLGGMTTVLGSATPSTSVAERVTGSGTCTISGTPRADHLVGTARRDVICGRGGDDVIRAAGGDDLLRGGDGRDRLVGGTGDDALGGGDGQDEVVSGDGADQLHGGGGADTLTSAAGRDVLAGGPGDDDLDGGQGSDDIDGGPGTNWCTLDADDTAFRCVYDEEPPWVESFSVSATSIDVTDGPQVVVARLHLTDDTGIGGAAIGPSDTTQSFFPRCSAALVEGDRRDGWWECALTFSRWMEPGHYPVRVSLQDRIGRTNGLNSPLAIDVQNATPDLEPPAVTLLAPSPDEVLDVRQEGAEVVVEARITDDLSGVASRWGVLWDPPGGSDMSGWGINFRRISGDEHDGIYRGTAYIPPGSVSGNWTVEMGVTDRAGQRSHWDGPDLPLQHQNYYDAVPFPDGFGRVPVLGEPRSDDRTPPNVAGASVSPTHIDTLPGPATVHVTVSLTDEESGVDWVNVYLINEEASGDLVVEGYADLTSGTPFDGVYEGDLTFPQGMPPGVYRLSILASDVMQNRVGTDRYETTVTVIDSTPDP
jgi:RTX calcium-binding nonapeptide repeat (4 copies)